MEFLNFLLAIIIIVVAAKAGGYITTRLGQPSVLGELLAGLILGPTFIDLMHIGPFAEGGHIGESITLLAELGVILLMMLAGLELHLSELLQSGKVAAVSGTAGVFIPLLLGAGTAMFFGADQTEAVFIGLALAATSVSISAQTLLELRVLRSRVGLALLGAAVFDDIFVILLLSIGSIVYGGEVGGLGSIVGVVVRMIGYLIGAVIVGRFVLSRLATYVNRLQISQGLIAFVLVATLLFAWAAQALGGMAAITGAFLVGLFLAQTRVKSQIEEGVSVLAYGFLVPIFFVNIGLESDLLAIDGRAWIFAIVLTIVAILGKIIGCGGGARLTGFNWRESLQLGIGMVSRGEVGLIVAAFAVAQNLLSRENFSITVFMVIVATLVTPPLLRLSFAGSPQSATESASETAD